ncbi:hypothetical protein ACLKA7_014918 [Drosophila subpalustris]
MELESSPLATAWPDALISAHIRKPVRRPGREERLNLSRGPVTSSPRLGDDCAQKQQHRPTTTAASVAAYKLKPQHKSFWDADLRCPIAAEERPVTWAGTCKSQLPHQATSDPAWVFQAIVAHLASWPCSVACLKMPDGRCPMADFRLSN